jgi:hypothetical protein
MQVNSTLKNFFMIFLKNAVNSLLTSSTLMAMNWGAFNVTSKMGWWNLGKVCLATIASREIVVWGPILLNWSTTSSNPAAIRTPGGGLQIPPPPPKGGPFL